MRTELIRIDTLRGAAWSWRAARSVRAQLERDVPLMAVVTPSPPSTDRIDGSRGVVVMLRRRRDSCLVRAIVRQAWHGAQGDARDVIVGIRPPSDGPVAHAWLDGDQDGAEGGWTEIARRGARPVTSRGG